MKIFVAHSSSYDYKNELYKPIRDSYLSQEHDIFLPKEKSEDEANTKENIKQSDVVLAEVSYPSTGQGIELGWADIFEVPIICMYKKNAKISSALSTLANRFIEYETSEDLIKKIDEAIKLL